MALYNPLDKVNEKKNLTKSNINKMYSAASSTSDKFIKSGDQNDLIKGGGEGTRGGKVIGHTKSGKAIYDIHDHPSHDSFTSHDHMEAAYANHNVIEKKLGDKSMEKDDKDYKKHGLNNDKHLDAYLSIKKHVDEHHDKYSKMGDVQKKKYRSQVKTTHDVGSKMEGDKDQDSKYRFTAHKQFLDETKGSNSDDHSAEIKQAGEKFKHVTEEGQNVNIIQHKNGEYNYNFHNNHKVGDTKHVDGSDMNGKVVHVIEGKKDSENKIKKSEQVSLENMLVKGEIADCIASGYGAGSEPVTFVKTGKEIKDKIPVIKNSLSIQIGSIEAQLAALKIKIGFEPTNERQRRYDKTSPYKLYDWAKAEPVYNNGQYAERTEENDSCTKYNTLVYLWSELKDDFDAISVMENNLEAAKKYTLSVSQLIALNFN